MHNPTNQRNIYSALRAAGKLTGTIKAALELRAEREAQQPQPTRTLQERLAHAQILVPILQSAADDLEQLARAERPRVKNWNYGVVSKRQPCGWHVSEIDHGRYSSRCTYHKITYSIRATSYALIRADGSIRYQYLNQPPRFLAPPHGYRWDRDANGLRLVSRRHPDCDYHPHADDLINCNRREMARKCRENAAKRRTAKRKVKQEQAAIRRAQRKGLAVCSRDSVRAGNCLAGTHSWANRHGLDRSHYTPAHLLRLANGDAHRVAVVVSAALRRHRREMQEGRCDLSDHR